ncbi:MAG: leucine-rich repeat domain-containing protein, partial [Bacteroidota bacterium]
DLENNKLTTLSSMTGLDKLGWIILNDNQLTSMPLMSGLASLSWIELENNKLTSLHPSMGYLPKLARIELSDNELTEIPQEFGNLPSLNGIRFYRNKVTRFPDEWVSPALQNIGATNNQLAFHEHEKFFDGPSSTTFAGYQFWPQDSMATFTGATHPALSDEKLWVPDSGQYSQYQWFKNGQPIPGATGVYYAPENPSFEDKFQCRITNTWVYNLTLWSKSISVPTTFYAIADGDWNEFIWSLEKDGPVTDTTPGIGSEVFIIGKHVTLRNDLSTGPIHVIVENRGASLTVDRAKLTVAGTLDLTKETDGYPGDVFVINGGRIKPINP